MISRKIVTGEREMLSQIYLKKGALVPMHSHESEQMTYVLQGALKFLIGGEEITVREGEVLHIPSWVEHQAEALDDTFELDLFSPIRQDWLDHTDTYFQGSRVRLPDPARGHVDAQWTPDCEENAPRVCREPRTREGLGSRAGARRGRGRHLRAGRRRLERTARAINRRPAATVVAIPANLSKLADVERVMADGGRSASAASTCS